MSKHTPGPWIADKLQDRSAFNIFASGFATAMCQVTCMENSTRYVTGNEVAANARLIAAAPDLLEALKLCMDAMFQGSPDADWETAYEKAKAAIAKAEAANG